MYRQSVSIDDFDKANEKSNDESFSSSNNADSSKGKRSKKVDIVSQFRRKSCHCSDCGGISKFELKVQDIFSAHNKQLKANLKKIRDKTQKKITNLYLGLPGTNTVILTENGHRGGKLPISISY